MLGYCSQWAQEDGNNWFLKIVSTLLRYLQYVKYCDMIYEFEFRVSQFAVAYSHLGITFSQSQSCAHDVCMQEVSDAVFPDHPEFSCRSPK